eukprot:TRINITY_DN3449_c1_g1_i6.p1 TRINITY_DN3449_c1_g1~~TRINITY_DN3449_c1_g1_i6.p1  ORF type:complete len:1325 (-),score=173.53 TRINITY_DN3449_c1_g1_i6:756-4730(-)
MKASSNVQSVNQSTHTVDNFVTIFSPAEIRVAVIPVGKVPKETFDQYINLIYRNRHVDLHVVNSFYKESGKSPFGYLPWKEGSLHFRFIQNPSLTERTPMTELHAHRRILGVIGICHCQLLPDVDEAYVEFERVCKNFPDAHVLRCFAFEPKDQDIDKDIKEKFQHLIMFPPGSEEIMEQHMEVVLNDFAACVMMDLEKQCSEAKPPIIKQPQSYMDTPHFALHQSTLEDVQKRIQSATSLSEDDIKKKKQYGRLRKFMGDCCMLAGTPRDAIEHYITGIEMAKQSGDAVWHGALLQSLSSAKVLDALILPDTVFNSDASIYDKTNEGVDLQKQQQNNFGKRCSGGFGGFAMWDAIIQSGVGKEAIDVLQEARQLYRKRGAIASLVELDLILSRFLTGLNGQEIGKDRRSQVFDMMSGVVDLIQYLYLHQDQVLTYKGVADVMSLISAPRKRALMLWKASSLCRDLQLRYNQFNTLQLAIESVEDPVIDQFGSDSQNYELGHQIIRREINIQTLLQRKKARAFHPVMSLLLQNLLDAAVYDGEQHGLAWDVAAALLREYCAFYNLPEQQNLLRMADEAAKNLEGPLMQRQGAGLPPLVKVYKVHPPQAHLRVQDSQGKGQFRQAVEKVMLVDNLQKGNKAEDSIEGLKEWVQGEQGTVELEVCNPCGLEIHLDRFGVMGQMEGLQEFKEIRMGEVQATIPPYHRSSDQVSSRVCLTLTPKSSGKLTLFGCRLRRKGVTWKQPFIRDFQHALALHPLDQNKFESKVQKFEVNVLPRMPILYPTLLGQCIGYSTKVTEPKSVQYAPQQPNPIIAVESEVLHVTLSLKNLTPIQVTFAQVYMGRTQNSQTKIPGISNTSFSGVFGFGDQQSLQSSTPILGDTVANVPLIMHIGNRLTDDQEPRLALVVEYGSNEITTIKEDSENGSSSELKVSLKPRFTRKMTIPFVFEITRGPTVKKFEFKEEWVPASIDLGDEDVQENGIVEQENGNDRLFRQRNRSLSLQLGMRHTPGGGRISCVLLAYLKNPTGLPITAQLVNCDDYQSWNELIQSFDEQQNSSVVIEAGSMKQVQTAIYPAVLSGTDKTQIQDLASAKEKELKKEYNRVAQMICGSYGIAWKSVNDSEPQSTEKTNNQNEKCGFIPFSQAQLKDYISRDVLSMVQHTSVLVYFTMSDLSNEGEPIPELSQPQLYDNQITRAVTIKVGQMYGLNIEAFNGDTKEAALIVSIQSNRVINMDVPSMKNTQLTTTTNVGYIDGLVLNGLVGGIQLKVGPSANVSSQVLCCGLSAGLYEVRAQVTEYNNCNSNNSSTCYQSSSFRIRTQKLYVVVEE